MDNLANRSYVGSVIVNESNSRFFEAAPGRKDPLKVRDFILNARTAAVEAETRDALPVAAGEEEPYDWRDA